MQPHRTWVLSILPFGAFLHAASAQTFSVNVSTIPGVTVAGSGAAQYSQNVDAVLGATRNQGTNDWLPYGFVASNNTAQAIVAFAARWQIVDSSGAEGARILTRSLMESAGLAIAPGESVVILPAWLLAGHHAGIPNLVNSAMAAGEAGELKRFQGARAIHVTLDGVVFASGQFAGPNVDNELPYFQAEGAAGYNLASAILAKKDAGVSSSQIVDWLQQTAATQASGTLQSRDWNTAVTAREAQLYLRLYRAGGESKVFAFAQQRFQGPHFAVHQ